MCEVRPGQVLGPQTGDHVAFLAMPRARRRNSVRPCAPGGSQVAAGEGIRGMRWRGLADGGCT